MESNVTPSTVFYDSGYGDRLLQQEGGSKKLIGSGINVGTEGIVIGMMTIDIRAGLQNRDDIAF